MAQAQSKTWRVHVKRGLIALAALALIAAFVLMVKSFMSGSSSGKKGVQQVAILRQPPPPPPKPPEKMPEPPKIKEELKLPEPEQMPDDKSADDKPASDQPLGVDADGGAGSDGFGLIGNKGGRDFMTTGGGSGAYYTGLLQRQFYEALQKNKKMLKEEFRVVVKIWFSEDGRVQKTDLVTGSGNRQLDELIQLTLAELPPLKEIPPAAMRQVQMRLSNRS